MIFLKDHQTTRNISLHLTKRSELFDVPVTWALCYIDAPQKLMDDFFYKEVQPC